MSAVMPRGACPSLSAPMQTGDGLLARLNPADGALTASQLAGVAEAAQKFGNGILEISSRGSLQIRGLTQASASGLRDAIAALGIMVRPGIEVRTGPLAGLDATETADPRPLAEDIRARAQPLAGLLAPKMSVVVDGGGALGLEELIADVRLRAVSSREWLVQAGMATLGIGNAVRAADAALAVLEKLAALGRQARGRDLDRVALGALSEQLEPSEAAGAETARLPVGRFALKGDGLARGFCLPFGQIEAKTLAGFADAVAAQKQFRLAPARGLLALNLSEDEDRALLAAASRLGLVTRPDDRRLRIAACAGAPACGSAHLATKAIARAVAAELPAGGAMVHITGCAKQCAKPAGPSATLIGTADGYEIEAADGAVRALLARIADAHGAQARRKRA